MKSIFFFLGIFVLSISAKSQVQPMGLSPQESTWYANQNQMTAQFSDEGSFTAQTDNPFSRGLENYGAVTAYAEYNQAGYLIMNAQFAFESREAKRRMAATLPEGVQLVLYTGRTSATHVQNIMDAFQDVIAPERVKIVYLQNADRGFWSRDAIPVPVYSDQGDNNGFSVVDARYYHRFEPDAEISQLFFAQLMRHTYFFEGGNFMANDRNECIIVDNEVASQIPADVFEVMYGCQKLVRLPHIRGIGHVDEVVKFVDANRVLTDDERFVSQLESEGFEVILLPKAEREYETYVNSLFVNGKAYIPTFGSNLDERALQVYRDLGFEAIALPSYQLSNTGLGSIHCITMTYPPLPFNDLLQSMGGSLL